MSAIHAAPPAAAPGSRTGGSSAERPVPSCKPDPGRRDRDCLGWAAPDYAFAGAGGFTGLFTLGLGYALFDDLVNVGVAYGFTPAFHAGKSVHSAHASVGFRPIEARLPRDFRLVPYAGLGLIAAFGADYFWTTPDRYEAYSDDYYPPTAWHATLHVGLELSYRAPSPLFERQSVYWEVRTLDRFLYYWVTNTDVVDPWEAWSSAFGYRLSF